MVSPSGACSYEYNTAEREGRNPVFFIRNLNLEKYQDEDLQWLD